VPRLLLLSNSKNAGQPYLEHAREAIVALLGGIREVVFIPYAGVQIPPRDYTARVGEALAGLGISVRAVTESADSVGMVRDAQAVVVGGGNTFQLLKRVVETGLLEPLRARAQAGMPYMGWSAGSNLACPTIRTTNDMPIVEPPSLRALGLVPFQINPHYTEAVLPNHEGETRAERIAEFVTLNPTLRVVGLREGSWLQVDGQAIKLHGPHSLKLFESGRDPREVRPDADIDFLLS
jgi:dipeptidase E